MNNQARRNEFFVSLLAIIMVLAMMPSMAFAANFDNDHDRISIATGEPVYVEWNGTDSSKGTVKAVDSSYYPDTFTLYVQNAAKVPEITSGSGNVSFAYDAEGENKAYIVKLSSAATIRVTLNNAIENNGIYTLSCSAPAGSPSTGLTLPTTVNGYLPVGQFASGKAWGSLFSNGDNLTGTTKKFLNGYTSTGVSLGAAGGYIDFNLKVTNKSTNPYGVDFIVYGNAFKGNPEAASVKVYGYTGKFNTNGKWYELAGSLYFDDITQRNKDVSYKKGSDGIYYQVTNHGVAPTDGGWKKFNTNTSVAWWPEDTEGYNNVWGSVDDVTKTDNIITYKNVSIVKDTDKTSDYQFGYADIHVNGSDYGTAMNPYTVAEGETGGDGFDLAWAVDESGNTVNLDHITKVRVYTSAGMKSDGSGVFTTPSIFGETSAEVCGVYGVVGAGDGDTTLNPTIKCGNDTVAAVNKGTVTKEVTAGTYNITVSGTGTGVYTSINGTGGSTYSVTVGVGETKCVRVIAQSGTKSPYVAMVKIVGK